MDYLRTNPRMYRQASIFLPVLAPRLSIVYLSGLMAIHDGNVNEQDGPLQVKDKARSFRALAIGKVRGVTQIMNSVEPFPTELVLHYSYHKCLTVYYIQVMRHLGNEFHFHSEYINTYTERVHKALQTVEGKKALHLGNIHELDYTALPQHRGSHIVRDPRDLIVSGYHYHKWSEEPWCNDITFDWTRIINHPAFQAYVEPDPRREPRQISYQAYLNTLDKDRGMILEMLWREPHFEHMLEWDYDNPDFIEIRYEEMIGNEAATYRRIFEHYGCAPEVVERGVHYADYFSMKHKSKGKRSHVRSGKKKQWSNEFSTKVKDVFKELNGELLLKLGYADSMDW